MKQKRFSVIGICMTGMFTALICVLAMISIPIKPVPFTLSLFAIFLTGAVLKPRYAFLAAMSYLLIGAIGIPVYANFQAGVGVLFGMTGGYLMAYPIMAWMIAMSVKLFQKRSVVSLGTGMLLSLLTCYFIGTLWFAYVSKSTIVHSLSLCVYPFVGFDLLKLVLAILFSFVLMGTPIKNYVQE